MWRNPRPYGLHTGFTTMRQHDDDDDSAKILNELNAAVKYCSTCKGRYAYGSCINNECFIECNANLWTCIVHVAPAFEHHWDGFMVTRRSCCCYLHTGPNRRNVCKVFCMVSAAGWIYLNILYWQWCEGHEPVLINGGHERMLCRFEHKISRRLLPLPLLYPPKLVILGAFFDMLEQVHTMCFTFVSVYIGSCSSCAIRTLHTCIEGLNVLFCYCVIMNGFVKSRWKKEMVSQCVWRNALTRCHYSGLMMLNQSHLIGWERGIWRRRIRKGMCVSVEWVVMCTFKICVEQ